jgi:hypothetical protein
MSMFCEAPKQVAAILDRVRTLRTVSVGTIPVTRRRHAMVFHGPLVHSESFSNRAEAVRKERYYKTGHGRDELDRLSS